MKILGHFGLIRKNPWLLRVVSGRFTLKYVPVFVSEYGTFHVKDQFELDFLISTSVQNLRKVNIFPNLSDVNLFVHYFQILLTKMC